MRWPLGLRPTRRGAAVAAVAGLAFAVGALTSARSLNAVVVPAVVALAAGAVQLVWADPSSVERTEPVPGFPGERRTVAVTVESAVPCTVTDAVGAGLSPAGEPSAAVGHGGRFEYAVELTARRDIHWRASAKRQADEFVVAEYESYAEVDAVTVVGEAPPEGADEMAATVASVAAFLHDAGVPVTVVVPGGRCVAPPGEMGPLLRLLAVTDAGRLETDQRSGADVYVRGEDSAATVSMEDREVAFGGVAGERRDREVVA
ncbi:hypothetical protein BRD07_06805 [Halobacteriales archaeon QS_9_68_42]|nr:MAG: hypothetical protein BRD07_06805 [Halobacteriales archaeon QS_9_68_42]